MNPEKSSLTRRSRPYPAPHPVGLARGLIGGAAGARGVLLRAVLEEDALSVVLVVGEPLALVRGVLAGLQALVAVVLVADAASGALASD